MGIKVWIMKGEVYGKRDLSPLVGMDKKQSKSAGSQDRNDRPQGGRPGGRPNGDRPNNQQRKRK